MTLKSVCCVAAVARVVVARDVVAENVDFVARDNSRRLCATAAALGGEPVRAAARELLYECDKASCRGV